MSTILKALRRLEEDKRTHAAMSLDEAVLEPASTTGRSGRAIPLAAGATALVGLAALLWATAELWLPGDESALKDVPEQVALEPARVAPASLAAPVSAAAPFSAAAPVETPIASLPAAPPDVAPIPIRAPSAAGNVEAFGNPEATRREMQRLVGAPPVASAPIPESKPESEPELEKRVVARAPTPAPSPVSAPASIGPVKVIQREVSPEVTIRQISWHPTPDRRVAIFLVEGESAAVPMREGDSVAGYTIAEIGISEVELVRDGVAVRRRIGN